MSDSLFRKKSLDKIKTPDTLNQYIRVASISSWVLIISIMLFLIGVIIWGSYGKIETKIYLQVFVENNTANCSVSDDLIKNIKPGMIIRIGKTEGTIWSIYKNAVTAKIVIPDGAYDASIIIQTIKPLSLLFN